MSDQGGTSEAGWQPDPHGRHEYRYWDGTAWTDQVSDGGQQSTDPPGDRPLDTPTSVTEPVATSATVAGPPTAGPPTGPPSTGMPPYVAPPDGDKPKSKVPVGILALVGVAVAAVVAALVIFLGGGDDGGGTGDFAGSVGDDEPFAVRTFDLEAGEAIRVLIEPGDDLDVGVTLGVDPGLATSETFGAGGDEDEILEDFGFYYDDLFSDAVDGDLSSDLSAGLSDDFSDFQDQLAEDLPSLGDAGIPFGTNNEHGDGDAEGSIFMAPLAGQYSIIVSGVDSEGEFDGKIETTGPSEDFDEQDPDEDIDLEAYYEGIDPLREFLCDEDFWGGDPGDVSEQNESLCDDDQFEDLLSGDFSDFSEDFSDDFTNDFSDFSDFSDDFSDFSDFSDDFSDFSDFSDDFSDDLSDDFVDEDQGALRVGDDASGTIDSGTRDTYTIEGNGALVTIEVLGTFEDGGLDPTVTVLDSSGAEIGFDDDGNPTGVRNSLLEINLESGETYTIAVGAFGSSAGDYDIRVS